MAKVTMEIPARRADQFAQFFRDEGLEVSYRPPPQAMERRSGGGGIDLSVVAFNVACGAGGSAAYALAVAAVSKIREKFPQVKIREIVEDDGDI